MKKRAYKNGFTLIELSLSLVFIAILSLSVVLMINNTVAAYRRGLLLDRLNTTGPDLVDEFRDSFRAASSGSIVNDCARYFSGPELGKCTDDGGYKLMSVTKEAEVTMEDETNLGKVPVSGVFCTGYYSYIWNSGYYFDGSSEVTNVSDPLSFKYKFAGESEAKTLSGFRLLRVRDFGKSVCLSTLRSYDTTKNGFVTHYDGPSFLDKGNSYVIDISTGYSALTEAPEDIMSAERGNNLALYNLEVSKPAESETKKSIFVTGGFVIGTIDGGVNVRARGQACQTPPEYGQGRYDYCAINKFNFAVQANGD